MGKENAASLLARDSVQFAAHHEALSGRVHSIDDEGSPVKEKIKGQTDTEQFRRWFGTFNENAKEDFSKFVNSDGTPRVLYRVPGEGNENMYTLEPVEEGVEVICINGNS